MFSFHPASAPGPAAWPAPGVALGSASFCGPAPFGQGQPPLDSYLRPCVFRAPRFAGRVLQTASTSILRIAGGLAGALCSPACVPLEKPAARAHGLAGAAHPRRRRNASNRLPMPYAVCFGNAPRPARASASRHSVSSICSCIFAAFIFDLVSAPFRGCCFRRHFFSRKPLTCQFIFALFFAALRKPLQRKDFRPQNIFTKPLTQSVRHVILVLL